jgi:hypothetical protein
MFKTTVLFHPKPVLSNLRPGFSRGVRTLEEIKSGTWKQRRVKKKLLLPVFSKALPMFSSRGGVIDTKDFGVGSSTTAVRVYMQRMQYLWGSEMGLLIFS